MVDVGVVPIGLGAIAVLLGISAFFSSSEIAIFTLAPGWIDERAAGGDRRARVLDRLADDPHRLLVTILVGNNVVNIAISSIATVVMLAHLPPGTAAVAATAFASVVVLVFGEIIPKSYGLGNAESWSLAAARPLSGVALALYPLVTAFDVATRGLSALVGGRPDIERPYADEGDGSSQP